MPELAHAPWWIGEAILIAVCLSRFIQLRYGDQILHKPMGVVLWRIWFGLGAQGIAGVWGVTSALAFLNIGMAPTCFIILVIGLGISAVYTASYSFDLANNILFQMTMLLPTMLVIFLFMPSGHGAGAFAFSGLMSLLYSFNTAVNLCKAQVQTLRNVEELEERDELIIAMLANIDQGFLILDADGRCSKIAVELEEWFDILMSGKVSFDLAKDLGPTMFKHPEGKSVKLAFYPLRTKDGQMSGVIMTALDVTAELRAARDVQESRERAELILNVVENRLGFRSFLSDLESVIARMRDFDQGDLAKLRLDLHTMKGTANMFGALALGRLIFDIEILSQGKDVAGTAVKFSEAYKSWQNAQRDLLIKIGLFEESKVEISAEKLRQLGTRFGSEFVRNLTQSEFSELLKNFETSVRFAAERLAKEVVLDIERVGPPIHVAPSVYKDILNTLTHMMNNSVDHGIEDAATRRLAGKPAQGHIHLKYEQVDVRGTPMIRLEIKDDGGGIDVARLREKMKNEGREGLELGPDLKIAQFIFEQGITTREEVSAISGQGIGMNAVHAAITSAGGDIAIQSTGRSGTVFVIHIPLILTDGLAA